MYQQSSTSYDGIGNGRGIIVVEPGSYSLRFGVVDEDDLKPHSMTNCIAIRKDKRKLKKSVHLVENTHVELELSENQVDTKAMKIESMDEHIKPSEISLENIKKDTFIDNTMKNNGIEEILRTYENLNVYLDRGSKKGQPSLSKSNCVEVLTNDNVVWTEIGQEVDVIIGDDALYIDDEDPYEVFFPFKYGQINRTTGLSDPVIFDIIHQIWEHAFINHLGIGVEEFQDYDVMLVIQDSYSKNDVSCLVDKLLIDMKFCSVFLQKESVCAAVGSGLQSCCVVNIGYSHTTVACVEDCEILEGSSFTMAYGGIDISKALLYLLRKNEEESFFKYHKADIDSSLQDMIIFEEMKESVCHLNVRNLSFKLYEFCERHRNQDTILYRINIGLPQLIAPLGLFHLKLFDSDAKVDIFDLDIYDKFDDYFQPLLIKDREAFAIKRSKMSVKKINIRDQRLKQESLDSGDAIAKPSTSIRLFIPDYLVDRFDSSPLHIAIVDSISSVGQKRVRQKMYNHVLLVGGGAMIEGLKEFIEDYVFDFAPSEVEKVEVSSIQTGGTAQQTVYVSLNYRILTTDIYKKMERRCYFS